jgi:hypothetical protein
MFLFHPDHAPYRLQRFADDNWRVMLAPIDPEPFDELGILASMACTLSSAAVGSRTFTAASAVFLASDVGRRITSAAGIGTITGYTSATVVTVDVTQAFPSTTLAASAWTIEGSPQTSCTPSAKDPVGTVITLTLAAAGWRVEDVGKYVRINGGLCKIKAFTSATIVDAVIETALTATVAAPALAWTLEGKMWGGPYGYPSCGTLFEQRLWLAGSPGFPQALWGSAIGEYLDFTLGTNDDEAMSFILAGGESNPIRHLISTRGLVALTTANEFSIRGGQERAITPTNISVKDQSNYGTIEVTPARVGQEIYFVQKAGRKIRALSPNQYDEGQYVAPDMATLAEHITESGIVDMAYQPEPDALLWLVRNDGQIATLSADRDQDVFGWSRQVTQGAFESIEVVPTPSGFNVFTIVARVREGVTTRYIEMFDATLNTDSAVTGADVSGATVWGGLDHLKGAIVRAKGDGVYLGYFLVDGSGEITIPRDAYTIEIGLQFDTEVLTLTPELVGPVGSSLGQELSIHETWVRLLNTVGCKVNLQEVEFRAFGPSVLDVPVTPYTGIKKARNLKWASGEAQTLIQQTLPYDFHLLSVINKITANEG